MKFIRLLLIFFVFIFFSGCQTIKEKSDTVVKKENQKYGKFIGKKVNELKIELGNPTDDFINEIGNKIFVYKSKKYGIPCDRKFELDKNDIVISFASSGCI